MRSPKSYLLPVLMLLVLGLATLTWKQNQELITLRGAALANGERADWQKRVWAAQKRVQSLESELAAAAGLRRPPPVRQRRPTAAHLRGPIWAGWFPVLPR